MPKSSGGKDRKMKYKYESVTGEVSEVEVDAYWAEVLEELDRKEYNNEKKETRRHCTLDVLGDEGEWMIDENADPFEALLRKEEEAEVNAMLDSLTENQRDIVEAVHFSGMNMSEYAEKVGITKQAARERIHWAMKKLKKVS